MFRDCPWRHLRHLYRPRRHIHFGFKPEQETLSGLIRPRVQQNQIKLVVNSKSTFPAISSPAIDPNWRNSDETPVPLAHWLCSKGRVRNRAPLRWGWRVTARDANHRCAKLPRLNGNQQKQKSEKTYTPRSRDLYARACHHMIILTSHHLLQPHHNGFRCTRYVQMLNHSSN